MHCDTYGVVVLYVQSETMFIVVGDVASKKVCCANLVCSRKTGVRKHDLSVTSSP